MNPQRKSPPSPHPTPLSIAAKSLVFIGIGLLRVISIPVGVVLWLIDQIPRQHRQYPHDTLRQTDQYHKHIQRTDPNDISPGRMALVFIAAVLMMIWILFL